MAMAAGSVSVNGSGIATGSGAALFLYEELIQDYPGSNVAQKQQVAGFANRLAKIITYIEDNAVVTVTVTTSTGGLQRVSGVDTDPPGSNKNINGTVT